MFNNVLRLGSSLLVSAMALLGPAVTHADEVFPSRTVKLIVPFTPGGTPDVIARMLSEKLTVLWKQPVIVENRPGGSSNIGADFVAKSPPDGHTLLLVPNNVPSINPLLISKMAFDPERDLASVTMLGVTPFLLVTGPSLNVNSVAELSAEAKRRPKGLSYASSGVGSNQHMFAEMLRVLTGAPMTHVPYKSGPTSITDVIGGVVDMQFGAVPSTLGHVRAGKLKALAVASSKRLAVLPNVPTMAEAGIKGFDAEGWIGLSAPARTPPEVIARINQDIGQVLRNPEVVAALAGYGIEAEPGTPAEMSARIAQERKSWGSVVSKSGIRAE
ncbi:MAG: tripartite tricarboxylate transporter substrate binding protein [Ramlibacter sp.]|nr:tripartite tricarboxylate transporter substrate binding protein [Ramlibacter sp.]MDB5914390.1 tripartite tricarboxylate transporter substrate binding protein [Ramlibacter sp.]